MDGRQGRQAGVVCPAAAALQKLRRPSGQSRHVYGNVLGRRDQKACPSIRCRDNCGDFWAGIRNCSGGGIVKKLDLAGQRFGRLLAIRPAPKNPMKKGSLWICLCDCGKETTVWIGSLRSGNTQSCGCLWNENFRKAARLANTGKRSYARLDLVGERFGRLTVLADGGTLRTPGGQINRLWEVICDCGKTSIVRTGSLRSGHAKSCGCAISDAVTIRSTRHGQGKRENKTPEYICWKTMRQRCYNKNREDYHTCR
jgi:hypothetical protein